MKRTLIAVLAVLALAVGATVASAHKGHDDKGGAKARMFTLKPDPAGESGGRRVRQALEGVLRRHHRRRRHLPRHARQRHRRALHPRRRRQVGRRPEGQARQALRRGRQHRLDHRLRHRHQGAGREVRDRQRRLPQRPPGHPQRRRLRDRLVPPDALARHGATQVAAGSGTPQALDVSAIPFAPASSTSTASWPRARASSSWSTVEHRQAVPDQARPGRRRRSTRSTRSRARRCRAATACCSTTAASWWSRATPAQLSFLKLRNGRPPGEAPAHADERQAPTARRRSTARRSSTSW